MSLLLDTHVLYWVVFEPEKLPAAVGEAVASPRQRVWISPVSTWELVIKAEQGRFGLIGVSFADLERSVAEAGFEELPVTVAHTLRVQELADHHRDPFDRLLVAQALVEGLTLVTADTAVRAYPVPTLWG